jgi:hypothetical protein
MGWSAYIASFHGMSVQFDKPFSSVLHHYSPLYFAYWGNWLDLTYWIPQRWAPGLEFQLQFLCQPQDPFILITYTKFKLLVLGSAFCTFLNYPFMEERIYRAKASLFHLPKWVQERRDNSAYTFLKEYCNPHFISPLPAPEEVPLFPSSPFLSCACYTTVLYRISGAP